MEELKNKLALEFRKQQDAWKLQNKVQFEAKNDDKASESDNRPVKPKNVLFLCFATLKVDRYNRQYIIYLLHNEHFGRTSCNCNQ